MKEVEVKNVVRPEQVHLSGFSATTIPVLVEDEDGLRGTTLIYSQDGNKRFSKELELNHHMINGHKYWFDPMPPPTNITQVSEQGRWTSTSRNLWLEGAPAPQTGTVLRAITKWIDSFLVFPADQREGNLATLSLWVMMTYLFRAFPAVPYLYFSGPLGSGKTRAMKVLARLAFRPTFSSSLTGPTLFRWRHSTGGTFFLDEAERMREDSPDVAELRCMLLAGYQRGASVNRLVPHGNSFQPFTFQVYGPTALACIKGLPPALASRCITIGMSRASKGEERVTRSLDDSPEQTQKLVDDLHCWSLAHGYHASIQNIENCSLSNRDAELWSPLLRIAAHSGDDDLVGLIQQHASNMVALTIDDKSNQADQAFLNALYQLREGGEFPTPQEVLVHAQELEPGCFDTYKARGLSNILKNYGIRISRSNSRRVFRAELKDIVSIAQRYSFELEREGNEQQRPQ